VDQTYIDATLVNLDQMKEKATELETISDSSYSDAINNIVENVTKDNENYSEIANIHNSRGYSEDIGVYKQFLDSSIELKDSYTNLVNNNDWVEIKWIDANMGTDGEIVNIDGTDYVLVVYDRELPKVGKRNNMGFRVGGTLTYDKNYYVTNISIYNDSENVPIDLSKIEELQLSGDGLASAEITEFNGTDAIKVTGKFNVANEAWEEVAAGIPIMEYNLGAYTSLRYEIYFEQTQEVFAYKYGGSHLGGL